MPCRASMRLATTSFSTRMASACTGMKFLRDENSKTADESRVTPTILRFATPLYRRHRYAVMRARPCSTAPSRRRSPSADRKIGAALVGAYLLWDDHRRRRWEFNNHPMERPMIKWAIIFAIISIIAGLFGFTGIAAGSAGIAKFLFVAALIIFLIFLLLALFAGKKLSE